MSTHIIETEFVLPFILGGNSNFTVENSNTDNHLTYKVRCPKTSDNKIDYSKFFVKAKTESGYLYIGMIIKSDNKYQFIMTKNSKLSDSHILVKSIKYLINALQARKIPDSVHFYHFNKCGRCGRTLTVPESIKMGIGPECEKSMKNGQLHNCLSETF